jgi:protein-tyrosine phosphatase
MALSDSVFRDLTRRSTVESQSPPYNRGIKILLVCTANQCRSPMAEGLLRAHLHEAGINAQVGSAGLLPGGSSAAPEAVAVMAERGIDITRHVSCQITADIARSANLIVGMSRHHVREACVSYGALLQRAFTLRELVRRGEEIGPRRQDETLYTWLGRVGAGRRPTDLVGDGSQDDIVDPIGKPRPVYEQTADELDDLLTRFLNLVIGIERPVAALEGRAGSHRF